MYDKRYSNQQINRIRQWASASMFFVMLLLCIGVGKVAYWIGHQNGYVEGYNDRMNDDVVNPVTSFVPAPAQVQKASFEIEVIAEPGDVPEWKVMLLWLMKYWVLCCIAVAFCAFCMVAPPAQKKTARGILRNGEPFDQV
jgi:hypothetical protein